MSSIIQNGVWSCGFDFLATGAIAAGGVFDIGSTGGGGCSVSSAAARFGIGQGIASTTPTTYWGRSLGAHLATLAHGFALQLNSLPGSGLTCPITFYDSAGGGPQFSLGINSQGQLGFYNTGGLPSATNLSGLMGSLSAAGTVSAGSYNFIEILPAIGSSGSIVCRVNGVTVLTFTGNTSTTGNAWIDRIYWGLGGPSGPTLYFDDFYLLDLSGPAPLNTFLGNGRVQTDGPNNESSTIGLNAWAYTTPQGSDFANCANIPPNTAQYNSSNVVSQRMSFRFPTLIASQCLFLNTWYNAEEDAAGSRAVVAIFRNSDTDQSGNTVVLSGSYTYYNQTSVLDPATDVPWADESTSAVSACEIGLGVIS